MFSKIKQLIYFSCIIFTALFSFQKEANAHAFAYCLENTGPGQVTFWLGSYHAGPPQGYIELNDGSTTVTANFTSTTYANTPSTLTTSDCTYIPFSSYTSASVTGWQEATITGLTVATYSWRYVCSGCPATWTPVAGTEGNVNITSALLGAVAITGSTPMDNATDVEITSDLTLQFSDTVTADTGNITLYRSSDNSVIETIAANGARVSGYGTSTLLVDWTSNLNPSTDYYVLIDNNAFLNGDGSSSVDGFSNPTDLNFTTRSAPVLSSSTPVDNAASVALAQNLILTFDQVVNVSTGSIHLYKVDTPNALIESIAANNGARVSGSGTNTITIDWSSNLGGSTDYFINIDNNAFTNNNGTLNYAGISDTTSLNFSTILKPSLSSSTPSDDGSGVYLNSNLDLVFNENVVQGTGNIVLYRSSDNSVIESLDVASSTRITGWSGSTLTIDWTNDLDIATDYYVQIDSTAIENVGTAKYDGINDTTTLNFSTVTRPTITSLNPSNGTSDISLDQSLTIVFSEIVNLNAGNIHLYDTSNNLIETVDLTGARVSGSGTNTILIDWTNDLDPSEYYYVQIDANAVFNQGGADFSGVSDNSSITFSTGTRPVLSSSLPTDNKADVNISISSIQLTFDKQVNIGTGNVYIKKVSDNSTYRTIDVTSPQVSGGGSLVVDLSFAGNLDYSTAYYVNYDAGSFTSVAANIPVAVLTDNTTFNFTTMGLPALVSSSPADDEIDVDLTTTSIKLRFSEAVRKGTGNIRLMNAEDDSEIESFDVSGSKITGWSTPTLTLNLTDYMEECHEYYILVDNTAVSNMSGVVFYGGISTDYELNFFTPPTCFPVIMRSTPTDDSKYVAPGKFSSEIIFSEFVFPDNGVIELRKYDNDEVLETISINDERVVFDLNRLNIDFNTTLLPLTTYYFYINATAIKDDESINFAGLLTKNDLNFSTLDNPFNDPEVVGIIEAQAEIALRQMDETIRPIRQRMDFVRRHIGKNSGAIAPHIIKPKNMPYNGLEFNFEDAPLQDILKKKKIPINLSSLKPTKINPLGYKNNPDGSTSLDFTNLSEEERALINSLPSIETLAETELGLLSPVKKLIPRHLQWSRDWASWISGRITVGRRDESTLGSKALIQSNGISFGVDKVLKNNNMFGFSGRIASDDQKIGNNGSSIETDIIGLSSYGTINFSDDYYIDGMIGINKLGYKTYRFDIDEHRLMGKRNAYQALISTSFNLEAEIDNFYVAPFYKIKTSYTELRPYTENGGNADIAFNSQKIISIKDSIGLKIDTYYFSKYGTFRPYFITEYERDFSNLGTASAHYANDKNFNTYYYELKDLTYDQIIGTFGLDFITPDANMNFYYELAKDVSDNVSAKKNSVQLKFNKSF